MTETWTTRGHPHPIREARAIIDEAGNYVAYVHPIGTEPEDVARADEWAALLVSAPQMREALAELHGVLRVRHHGRMPDEVQHAYDRAGRVLRGTP